MWQTSYDDDGSIYYYDGGSSAYEDYNHDLNKYFSEKVQISKEKKKRINDEVVSELMDILYDIHEYDPRFEKYPMFVGSRYQGLMVDIVGDIDMSVVLKLGSKSQWNFGNESRPRYYGFKPINGHRGSGKLNSTSSLSRKLQIGYTNNPLPHPGPGYVTVRSTVQDSHFGDMMFDGDLIPFKVKQKFRSLLKEARADLHINDSYQLSPVAHGPAQTMETSIRVRGTDVPVDMDLAVVIRAGLPFLPDMNWPRQSSRWPPPDVVKFIRQKGFNIAAQDPFNWKLSFAELEKDLVKQMDRGGRVNTCRKKVHRITKSILHEVSGKNPTLSTYMLKNVWLWECEKFPDAKLWTEDKLTERYVGCLRSLLRCAQQGKLLQYFDNRNNLFGGKNMLKILEDIGKISRFLFDQNISVHHLVVNGDDGDDDDDDDDDDYDDDDDDDDDDYDDEEEEEEDEY